MNCRARFIEDKVHQGIFNKSSEGSSDKVTLFKVASFSPRDLTIFFVK